MIKETDEERFQRITDMFIRLLYKSGGEVRRGELTRMVAGRALSDELDAVADSLRDQGKIAIDLKEVRGKAVTFYRWCANEDLKPAPVVRRAPKTVRPRTDAYMTLNRSVGQLTLEINNLRNEAAWLGDKIGQIGQIAGQALVNSQRAEQMADRLEKKGDELISALDRVISYTK